MTGGIADIIGAPTCAVCRRQVDAFEIKLEVTFLEVAAIMTARCHGATEVVRLSCAEVAAATRLRMVDAFRAAAEVADGR